MNDVPQVDDPSRSLRLRLLMIAIAILLPAAILVSAVLGVVAWTADLPADIRVSPLVAVALYVFAFTVAFGCFALCAILAAWISLKRHTRAEVRAEFLWAMWLPKTSGLSGKLFDRLFKREEGAHLSSNTSLERTRDR